MSEHIGRLNRARISRDRYEPVVGGDLAALPTYRVSLYEPEGLSPTRRAAIASSSLSPTRESRRIVAAGQSPPPPPPPSVYAQDGSPHRRVTMSARELRATQQSGRLSGEHRQSPYKTSGLSATTRSSPPQNARYISSHERTENWKPESSQVFADFDEESFPAKRESVSGRSIQKRNFENVASGPGERRFDSTLSTSPIHKVSESGLHTKKAATPPPPPPPPPPPSILHHGDMNQLRKDIDQTVVEALNLQDQGKFEEAHFLLLKVERMRLELELGEEQKRQQEKQVHEEQNINNQQATNRPRRASLVLEEIRRDQFVRQPPAASKVQDDGYPEEEFDSLSEDDEVVVKARRGSGLGIGLGRKNSSSALQMPAEVIQEMTKALQDRVNIRDEEKTTEAIGNQASSPSAAVVIPVAHVDVASLEEERERRKREFRKRRDEEQQQLPTGVAQPEPPISIAQPALPQITDDTQSTSRPRVEEKNDDVQQPQMIPSESDNEHPEINQEQQKETVEQAIQRAYFADHALSFSEASPLSVEHVKLNAEETNEALKELEKRRRERMMNPTKSSRLPGLQSSRKHLLQDDEGYTAKEGYLVKLTEAPRISFMTSAFHKRYFVLSGGVLIHMKSKESQIPRGMISLDTARVRLVQCDGVQNGYCVAIETPNQRNYTLFPENRKEAVEWAVAIEHNGAVFARLKHEESFRTKQLARRKLSESRRNLSVTNVDTNELLGKDVASDDFRDFTFGSPSNNPEDAAAAKEATVGIGGFYDLLGVPANATTDVIKKSYHKLAKMFHPDKNTTIDPERFALINRAFHVVQDPESRERYNLGERVKHALRQGVLVHIHDDNDGESWPAALYISPTFSVLYWQEEQFGSVLKPGFNFAELRFVQEVIAGEDDPKWTWAHTDDAAKRCLSILGQRLGHEHIRLELDTEESRDEVLDGLRILRCDQSMLFVQKLEQWLKDGQHR